MLSSPTDTPQLTSPYWIPIKEHLRWKTLVRHQCLEPCHTAWPSLQNLTCSIALPLLLSNRTNHKMSDYNMLAFSSQRSGRHEMEGLAHYSAGVTMDSMGQYPKALESYKKFLVVCK